MEVQSGRRLIEDIERAARGALRELLGEFHALGLAARQRRRLLADMDVVEPDALQGFHLLADRGHRLEQLGGLLDRRVEDVGDRLAAILHLQGLAVVALALADVAGDVDVGQEVHLDLDDAIAGAGLAAAALHVEGEAPRLVASGLGLGQSREPVADRCEGAGIGRRVRARRAPDRRLVDVDHLVEKLQSLDALVRGRMLQCAVQLLRCSLVERIDDEGRLAAARDPGDAGEGAKRDRDVDVLQVVAPCANDPDVPLLGRAARRRHAHGQLTGEVFRREGGRVVEHLRGRALRDDLAAMDSGARADIDDVVGLEDRILVVLDDDHRVAEVSQALEGPEQALVIALVQADRGLVEHVEHAGQPRSDLRGEADALALTTRERAGAARQRQVFEADIDEESQPVANFFQDSHRDLVLLVRELGRDLREPPMGFAHRECGDLPDILHVDLHRQRLWLEPLAVAGLAGGGAHEAADVFPCRVALRLLVAPLQVRDDALERLVDRVGAQTVIIGEAHRLLAGAVEDRDPRLRRQRRPRHIGLEVEMLGQRFERLVVIGRGRLRPGRDGAALEAQGLVGDHEFRVDPHLVADAAADRAGTERVVEGEEPGLDLGDGETRDRAGKARRERDLLRCLAFGRIGEFDVGDPVGEFQGGLERLGEAACHVVAHHDAVHHHVDVVLELLVELRHVVDRVVLAVDAKALEALLLEFCDLFAVLALPPAHDGREQIQPRLLGQFEHAVDHLADGLAFDRQAGDRRIGNADARPEQAHVVVDLGDGAHRRARVFRGRLLLDGDGRREPVDLVDIRLRHHLQELPGIGRQRLDVAALALGIDRIEGERGFARAREAREHHELIARDRQVDVLEIVLARAAHGDDAPVENRAASRVEQLLKFAI
ncbi:hypothetical protein MMMDOFMJ_4246 [Methylobacterium gnaphalii]|nr:hypothetical protein MMMDOFMJ_4246 [Methylobacterium gnaphalii]